jgi:hypothetical protein
MLPSSFDKNQIFIPNQIFFLFFFQPMLKKVEHLLMHHCVRVCMRVMLIFSSAASFFKMPWTR